MRILNIIAWILLVIGGLNWLLVGLFSWNLVSTIFMVEWLARIIYCLVGLSAIWILVVPFINSGKISLFNE